MYVCNVIKRCDVTNLNLVFSFPDFQIIIRLLHIPGKKNMQKQILLYEHK